MWREITMLSSFAKSFVSRRIPFWGGDGREYSLLKHVLQNAEPGNPDSVLFHMDEFAKTGTWFMSIGDRKGVILDSAVTARKPKIVLELGSYCGYSAVRIARLDSDIRIISLEINPKFAEVAKQIIEHAGVSSRVQILEGPLKLQVSKLKSILNETGEENIHFVFMDHSKEYYLTDYLLLKESGLIGEGSVIFSDNMEFPGSPDFWNYLNDPANCELTTVYYKTKLEYLNWISDTVTVSTFHRV